MKSSDSDCSNNRRKKRKRKVGPVGPLKTRTLLNGYTTWQKANSETDMGVKRHIIVEDLRDESLCDFLKFMAGGV